jgi:hypothetical protein
MLRFLTNGNFFQEIQTDPFQFPVLFVEAVEGFYF